MVSKIINTHHGVRYSNNCKEHCDAQVCCRLNKRETLRILSGKFSSVAISVTELAANANCMLGIETSVNHSQDLQSAV